MPRLLTVSLTTQMQYSIVKMSGFSDFRLFLNNDRSFILNVLRRIKFIFHYSEFYAVDVNHRALPADKLLDLTWNFWY